MKKIANRYSLIVFILSLLIVKPSLAQKTDWFALSNCSNLVQFRSMDVDANGNTYTGGEYTGEANFNSASETGPKKTSYASTSWSNSFLIKHDASGELKYLINMQTTGSNSHLTYIKLVKCLKDGRLAVILDARSEFRITDAENKVTEIKFKTNTHLLFFDAAGRFQQNIRLPVDYSTQMLETETGMLYLIGIKQAFYSSSNIQKICVIHPNDSIPELLPMELSDIRSMVYHQGKIYLLKIHSKTDYNYIKSGSFTLYTLNNQELIEQFTKNIGPFLYGDVFLSASEKELMLAITASPAQKNQVEIDHQVHQLEKDQSCLVLFDEEGTWKGTVTLSTLIHYNLGFVATDDGGFILQTPCIKDLVIENKSMFTPEKHSDFVNELLYIKFDKSLKVKSVINGGGTASNYHTSQMIARKNTLYTASDLMDFGHFDFGYLELHWKSGFYIRKINLL